MDVTYSRLKKMDVVGVTDGKNLGKVCDITLLFPEGQIKGVFVTGGKGFRLTRSDCFVPFSDIVKIGEDVVLVRSGGKRPPNAGVCRPQSARRSFDDYE